MSVTGVGEAIKVVVIGELSGGVVDTGLGGGDGTGAVASSTGISCGAIAVVLGV